MDPLVFCKMRICLFSWCAPRLCDIITNLYRSFTNRCPDTTMMSLNLISRHSVNYTRNSVIWPTYSGPGNALKPVSSENSHNHGWTTRRFRRILTVWSQTNRFEAEQFRATKLGAKWPRISSFSSQSQLANEFRADPMFVVLAPNYKMVCLSLFNPFVNNPRPSFIVWARI